MAEFRFFIVAFIDILGFSNMVKEDAQTLTLKNLSSILNAINSLKATLPLKDASIQVLSDSIILTTPLSQEGFHESLFAIASLQELFLGELILVRGGLSFGKHFQSEDVLFSEALVHAYQIEKDISRFPRVVIDHNLWDWFINNDKIGSEAKKVVRGQTIRDSDGHIFISYINSRNLENQKGFILKCFEKVPPGNPSVLEKLQWLVRLFNFIARSSGNPGIQIEKIKTDFALQL